MKKLICASVLLISLFGYGFGEELQPPKANIDTPNKPTGNNITGGLFFGLSLGTDFIQNNLDVDNNLTSFNYSKDSSDAGKRPSFGGINTEARLGLIKTTKNVGLRIYGYYGRAWDSMQTLGLRSTPINADSYYETAYLDAQYYGGMADIMFGAFQSTDFTGYFTLGGGYQITDYKLSGTASLGYADSAFLDGDIYRTSLSGKKSIQSPVVNVGGGLLVNKHHLFEVNLRFLLVNPTFVTDASTKLIATAGLPFYKKYIPDDTAISIRESFGYNMNLTFNYMYIF